MNPIKILVVDDDEHTLELFLLLGELLQNRCEIWTASNGRATHRCLEKGAVDMVILDVVMPDKNGYQLCQELQKHPCAENAYYILMSAERYQLVDRIRAYQLNVQDFILKPFDVEETKLLLLSKIHFLQQQHQPVTVTACQMGDFHWDQALKVVRRKEQPLELSNLEYNFFMYLALHPQRVFTSEELLKAIWGADMATYYMTDSNVRKLVYQLRKKIEPDPQNPRYLVNIKHKGYAFFPSGVTSL